MEKDTEKYNELRAQMIIRNKDKVRTREERLSRTRRDEDFERTGKGGRGRGKSRADTSGIIWAGRPHPVVGRGRQEEQRA